MAEPEEAQPIYESDKTVTWGYYPTQKKHFRLMYQNQNGIKMENDLTELRHTGALVSAYQVDMLCLAETNLDWEARDVKLRVIQVLRNHWKTSKVATSSSSWTWPESSYQPGGTLTLVGNPWASRATTGADSSGMGRWSEVTITGKTKKVTFVTAYRVCQQKGARAGPKTSFIQQCCILRTRGKSEDQIDPRSLMLEDLGKRITALKEDGQEVVLSIDANDTLQCVNSGFTKFARQNGLTDILVDRHGTEDEPPTYARGSFRIDYVMATAGIAQYVTSAGILPLKAISGSDHRPTFVDFDLTSFLGDQPFAQGEASSRSIGSDKPRAVKVYRKQLEDYLNESGIEQDLEKACVELDDPNLHDAAVTKMQRLQQRITNKRLEIEKKCAKLDNSPWSPQLRDAVRRKTYFRIWVSEFKLRKDFSQQRRKVWDIPEEAVPTNLKEAETLLKEAVETVKNVLIHARDIRKAHLIERAEAAAADGRPMTKKAILAIVKAEKKKKSFERLRRILGKTNNGGLTHIINSKEEMVLDPAEMFAMLLERNKGHFSQADGTPFTQPAMTDLFGKYGTNAMSKLLLDGKLDLESMTLSDALKAILGKLKRLTPEGTISHHITASEIEAVYRKWRESTSTSPSGLHLGHEKALFRFESKLGPEDPKLSVRMFEMKAKFLNAAIEHGIVYERWETVVNALIEKIPGMPMINKLRVIHLIESDFNLLIGILFGRRMMHAGEELDAFGHDQDGCRADRKATDTLMDKLLRYSIGRLTLTDYATFDNDAKSCFDRIVMLPVSLIAQRLGMHPKACELFIKTLRAVRYHVKTQMGISDGFYTTTEDATIHGPGQGGRGSPAVWVAECCLAMECMNIRSNGMTLTDPFNEIETTKIMSGFVDDTTHWINNFKESLAEVEHLTELIMQTKETAQWWEELLNAVGGKLELPKCFFYLVHWIFNDEGEPTIVNPILLPSDIELQDSETGNAARIATKSSYESHKTLGVMMNPAGTPEDEIKRLSTKSRKFAQRVSLAAITKLEAMMLYTFYFLPSIGYGLAVGILTLLQAAKIQSKPLQVLLPKMGFSQKTAGAVVFGPRALGGVGLRHLFAEQGTQKVQMILQQLRVQKPLGRLLITQLRWSQRIAGISEPILVETKKPLPQLAGEHWISTLREFLQQSNLAIEARQLSGIATTRAGDTVIMDRTYDKKGNLRYTAAEVKRINRCRTFLRSETMADICNAEGTRIREECMELLESGRNHTDELWPRQPRPGPEHRRIWKRFLRETCNDNRTLLQPLGKWNHSPSTEWNAYYDKERHKAVTTEDFVSWQEWDIEPGRRGWKLHSPVEVGKPCNWTIEEMEPADLGKMQNATIISWFKHAEAPRVREQPEALTARPVSAGKKWTRYLKTLPVWERKLIETSTAAASGTQSLVDALENPHERLTFVSNGGVKDGRGAFGWVAGNSKGDIIAKGEGTVWGSPITSYRAEAFGKLAWICFSKRFIEYHGIKAVCRVRSFCDNSSVISHTRFSHRHLRTNTALKADWDVLRAIAIEQAILSRYIDKLEEGLHVKGHQDKAPGNEPLTEQAELNIAADAIASKTLETMAAKGVTTRFIPLDSCMAYLTSDSLAQTSGERETLRWSWSGLRLQHYYMSHFNKDDHKIKSINWAGMAIARRKLSQPEQVFSIKLCTDHLATGSRMELYGHAVTHCYRCSGTETVDHLFQCPANMEYKRIFAYTLQQQLEKVKTIPAVAQAIVSGVAAWLNDETIDHLIADKETIREIRNCLIAQNKIGWNLAMRGLLANEWAVVQETFVNEQDDTDRILGDSWSAKVALWITKEARKLWLDRNEAMYQPVEKESRLEEETKANVRDLYSAEMKMAEADRWIFANPLHDMLRKPVIYQAQWVARHTKLILQCAKEVEELERNNLADIRTFYEPKPKGTPSPIRTPLQPTARTVKRAKMKATALIQYFETTTTPTTRLRQSAKSKAREDKKKEDEKRRKAKLKKSTAQSNIRTFFQPREETLNEERGGST
jgi:hypothetical protein